MAQSRIRQLLSRFRRKKATSKEGGQSVANQQQAAHQQPHQTQAKLSVKVVSKGKTRKKNSMQQKSLGGPYRAPKPVKGYHETKAWNEQMMKQHEARKAQRKQAQQKATQSKSHVQNRPKKQQQLQQKQAAPGQGMAR